MTRFDLGLEFSGGFPAPTVEECTAQGLCRAKLDAVGEPSLEYVSGASAVTADGTLSAALAPFLRGTGLTVDGSGRLRMRNRPRRIMLREPWISGPAAAGAVVGTLGALGWTLAGVGTPTLARASRGLVTGVGCLVSTSGSANDRSSLMLGIAEASAGVANVTELGLMQCVMAVPTLTSVRAFFGLSSDFSQNPLTTTGDCIGIVYDSGSSPNYQSVSRNGGAGVPSVSSTAAASSMIILTVWQPTTGNYQFYAGNTLLGTLTGSASTGCNVGWRLETLTGAVRTLRVADFLFESTDLAGAWDDDAFLEV